MKRLVVGLLILLAVSARTATAAQLDFRGLGNASVVSVGGIVSGSFYAGELNWSWLGEVPAGFESSLYTYCVDLLNAVRDPQTVEISSTNAIVAPATDAGGKAAWLFNTFASGIREAGSAIQAAALQVAIWEALYDNDGALSTGAFQLYTSGTNGQAIFNTASQYLNQLFFAPGLYHTSTATLLDVKNGYGQDQITRVPEPTILGLLGIGAIAAYGYRRRTRAGNPDRQ